MPGEAPMSQSAGSDRYEDAIDLAVWARALWKARVFVGISGLLGTLGGAASVYVSPPVSVAEAHLLLTDKLNEEETATLVGRYEMALGELWVCQQVVDELGLSQESYGLSAAQFRSQALVVTADRDEGRLIVAVSLPGRDLSTRAVGALLRHGAEFWRLRSTRADVRQGIDLILELRSRLPDLVSEVDAQEVAVRVLSDRARAMASLPVDFRQDFVRAEVRLAQLRARRDRIVDGLQRASDVAAQLARVPPTQDVPQALESDIATLEQRFGLSAGRSGVVVAPFQQVGGIGIRGDLMLARWAGSLILGLLVGLSAAGVLVIAGSMRARVKEIDPPPASA